MIIVKLFGGLGNQLFQYAAGRSLALKKNTDLALDVSGYGKEPQGTIKRNYELHLFNICASPAKEEQINKIAHPPLADRILKKLGLGSGFCYYREPFFHFDADFFESPASTILDGYWQSEKYFKEVSPAIRADLQLTAPLSAVTREMAAQIDARKSVSLHVRRGDFVNNPQTFSHHGVCEPGYYREAIGKIKEQHTDLEVFVFSDDMDWAKENITTDLPMTFVNGAGRQDFEDLYLMSLCRHNIIANSSFSWWGAWLNPNPKKIVVAPARWFNDKNTDTKDLLPPEWVKL